MKKLVVTGTILLNKAVNENVKHMVIKAPEIANLAEPGQFVHVKTLHSENFLRRPFSIADVDKNEGTITLIYRIVGKGTAEYSRLKEGEEFSILGPIGNGFKLKEGRPLLVGGGVGIAPLIYLSRLLKDQKPILLIGGKNKDEVFWEEYLKEYADSLYRDEDVKNAKDKYPYCTPFTKESLLYRDIFESYYPGKAKWIKDFWMPNKTWENCDVNDPSARVLKNYGDSGK